MSGDRFRPDAALLPLMPPDMRAEFEASPRDCVEILSDPVDALEFGTRRRYRARPFLGEIAVDAVVPVLDSAGRVVGEAKAKPGGMVDFTFDDDPFGDPPAPAISMSFYLGRPE